MTCISVAEATVAATTERAVMYFIMNKLFGV